MRAVRTVICFFAIIAIAVLWRTVRISAYRRARQPIAASLVFASSDALLPATAVQKDTACKTPVGYRVMRIGDRVAAIWYPTTAPQARYYYTPKFSSQVAKDAPPSRACGAAAPLVVFSHGDLGCGIQSIAFTEELARNGYVVAAPDHADAMICHIVPSGPGMSPDSQPRQPRILDPGAWNDASRSDRRQDVENVIDDLLQDKEFTKVIDPRRIGLAGHSLGGYTVVGIAGGWQSWLDPRIRAVLAFSPYVMPFQVKNTLGDVHVPLMYQGGTLDVGITPFLKGSRGAYATANPPAYFVELRRAGHFAWTNCGDERTTESCLAHVENARLIAQYGVAFFNRYLKGLEEPTLEKQNPLPAEYRFR
jgi:predicted dienelactone hydrolase